MKHFSNLFFALLLSAPLMAGAQNPALKLFKANDRRMDFVGRMDLSNPQIPRIWAPGVYITAKFKGRACEILINDEKHHVSG